jgi:hypothetical protein
VTASADETGRANSRRAVVDAGERFTTRTITSSVDPAPGRFTVDGTTP